MTNKTHYVYKITNLNPIDKQQFYIGVHSDENSDSLNDGYWGSSKYLDESIKNQGIENFKKEVLSYWNSREEAESEESRLHQELGVASNPNYYNRHNATANGFSTIGMTNAIDTRTDKKVFISVESYHAHDYYIGLTANMTVALNKNTNKVETVTSDMLQGDSYKSIHAGKFTFFDTIAKKNVFITLEEFNNNDRYVACNKGQVTVRDTRDNSIINVTKETYNKNPYYISIVSGKLPVRDVKADKIIHVTKEEFKTNPNYVSVNSTTIRIYDEKGKLQFTSHGKFSRFCEEHDLPTVTFQRSYSNNGSPIYSTKNPSTIGALRKSGNIKYKGWYAIQDQSTKPKNPNKKTNNFVIVRDLRDGTKTRISKEEFKNNPDYVSVNSTTIRIYDCDGVLQFTSYEKFSKFCEEHGLPYSSFKRSYRNNGTPIYTTTNKPTLSGLIKNGNIKYKGWYAIKA